MLGGGRCVTDWRRRGRPSAGRGPALHRSCELLHPVLSPARHCSAIACRRHGHATPPCSPGRGAAGPAACHAPRAPVHVRLPAAAHQPRRQNHSVRPSLAGHHVVANSHNRTGKPLLTVSGGRSGIGGGWPTASAPHHRPLTHMCRIHGYRLWRHRLPRSLPCEPAGCVLPHD